MPEQFPVSYSPGNSANIKFTYKNNDGEFHLDGNKGKAIYKFPGDGSFYSDSLGLIQFATMQLDAGGVDNGVIYKVPNESFWLFFSIVKLITPNGDEFFRLYYSLDGNYFQRWVTPTGTDRFPLQQSVPEPPVDNTLPSNPPGSTSPDGKKINYPVHVEGSFNVSKGYVWVNIGPEGAISLRIEGKHSGVSGSTRFSAAVLVTGLRNGVEHVILNEPETRTLTVGANSLTGTAKKDKTWTNFPIIAPDDRKFVRSVRVLFEKDKSVENFVEVVKNVLNSAEEIFDEAEALYKKVKQSEIGQDVAVAIAGG